MLGISASTRYDPILLIDEVNLTHGEFRICDKLERKYFKSKPYTYSKSRYIKPSSSKVSEEYCNSWDGISYWYDDQRLEVITIFFPRRDTTLRGISVGHTQRQVEAVYGKPTWNIGIDGIGYSNICFLLSDSLVYGIYIYDENDCED